MRLNRCYVQFRKLLFSKVLPASFTLSLIRPVIVAAIISVYITVANLSLYTPTTEFHNFSAIGRCVKMKREEPGEERMREPEASAARCRHDFRHSFGSSMNQKRSKEGRV